MAVSVQQVKTNAMDEEEVVKGLHKELQRVLKSKEFNSLTPKHQKFVLGNIITTAKRIINTYKL